MKRSIITFFLVLSCCTSYAWNAMGHQLVAQIAYDNLTPAAKKMCNNYNRSYSADASNANFIVAATWLDAIRANDIHWFDSLHYIDIPFSYDETPLPPLQEVNALWGIKQAITVLSSEKSSMADKGLSLRILTHLIGDVHQPLHTVTKVSKRLPRGDMGGNLFKLAHNPIGDNLHKYWDNGAGSLTGQSKQFQVKNKARQLEQKWPCSEAVKEKNPRKWINASHQLALNKVYKVAQNKIPGKRYQLEAQNITQKQILLAGCRLATVLNGIAAHQAHHESMSESSKI
ncbi:S1/P1 nuclease [Legionella quateirensis]|uniref:3'-nucleotidase/nuclease n=1 Tax=Legionella quateirensis TaxID=45072 RepID=A0A378KUB5_9GAMM|nr:S1/P1 nuclease [Legionella quateirensis]KTD50975.1 3'-nucleotidase/nuclease [Legionella quateirensis]STY17779.1 3'-nucleotidase/nuclease [Legionella quateirensis]